MFVVLALAALAVACAGGGAGPVPPASSAALPAASESTPATAVSVDAADVLEVSVSGTLGAYTFSVTVASPDTGCQRYADWWEVLTDDGELLYRRILLHSHVDEQPFTRSGGPVAIDPDSTVLVRAHISTEGYGGLVLRGSVESGFAPTEVLSGFAAGLASEGPLPQGCAF